MGLSINWEGFSLARRGTLLYNALDFCTSEMTDQQNEPRDTFSLSVPSMTREELAREHAMEKREKKLIVGLLFLGVVFAAVIGEVTFYNIYTKVVKQEDQPETEVTTEENKNANLQYETINKLAYIENNNVVVYDLWEHKPIPITSNGGGGISHPAIAWKNKDEVSFAQCSGKTCIIQTYSLRDRKTVDSFDFSADTVRAIKWSRKGDTVAYVYTKKDVGYLEIKTTAEAKSLKSYEAVTGKPVDYNDYTEISFSPNDDTILLTDTQVPLGQPSLFVIQTTGEEKLTIPKTQDDAVTFGFFSGEKTIYYKKGDYLYIRSLDSGEETQLTDRIINAFHFRLSPDKTKIAYWTYDWTGGVATVWTYELGTGTIKRFIDYAAFPVWVDDDTLVFSKMNVCNECALQKIEFTGFATVEYNSKKVEDLVEVNDVMWSITRNE